MTCKFNVPGKKRKELALTIATWLGCEVSYKGAPTFTYEIDYFTIDRDGNLSFDDRADSEVIERLFEHLYDEGFDFESAEPSEEESESGVEGVAIQLPMEDITPTALDNLFKLIDSKAELIKKAIGCDSVNINLTEDGRLEFPWFARESTPEEAQTYMLFVTRLVETAKAQKRVTAKQKEVENEKFAFRCFLLKLGFIGDEYKLARKILLKNFEGSSAFKSGKRNEVESDV